MRDWASYTLDNTGDDTGGETGSGGATLVLTGRLVISAVGPLDRDLRTLDDTIAKVDLSQVEEIDTVGAWIVWRVANDHNAQIVGASEGAQRLIDAVGSSASTAEILPPRVPLVERVPEAVGQLVTGWGRGTVEIIGFLGAILVSWWGMVRHPSRFPMKALVRQIELVGVNSLGIIALMSFLIGIVIAQQGAVQLRQFGAEVYTINLTGRLTLRELGVLMTAIMVAGRSGSAFAAQLGTMKLTEEVDAMRTIGVSPIDALVLPRILAVVLMMPLLGFFSAVVAPARRREAARAWRPRVCM